MVFRPSPSGRKRAAPVKRRDRLLSWSGCLVVDSLGQRQAFILGLQFLARFAPGGIEGDAGDRAYLLALRLVEVPDALGALVGVDLVKLGAHRNGLVRAFGLADVAIDAIVGNQ
jgi:hypothetical protein